MKIGYARVSTHEQNLDSQIDALEKAGCEKIVTEKVSSRKDERPKLKESLNWLREGDYLICTKMDRLARSIKELLLMTEEMNQKKIFLAFSGYEYFPE